jgi:CHAT domain-containing protein
MALNACERARQSTELPTQGDLDVLGEILIPSLLNDQLTTETFLILSPHKKLHAIPWAGLLPQFSSECLVNICIPTVVPSLRSLYVLWQRNNFENSSARENGLVVGLSSFGGKYRELPSVRDEVSFLRSTLGASGSYLVEKDAAWENILKLDQLSAGKEAGLSRFSWLHIASHFFSDALVGRLGSLALSDSDIWLDKLYDLSSLPNLVTLSACNGISSFVYEGDEHVDFPSTCLAAGANSVVGSLWPVLDGVASEFTSVFYMHYLEGMSPAKAVAHTQREMMGRDGQAGQWASFMCVGLP